MLLNKMNRTGNEFEHNRIICNKRNRGPVFSQYRFQEWRSESGAPEIKCLS